MVTLSKIFEWYREDFGKDQGEILSRLAEFLYNGDEREFVKNHVKELKVSYQKYDWRLNRSDKRKKR
jgi:hypothetical protein